MTAARSTPAPTLELGEGPRGPTEPAPKASAGHARPRLGAPDNSARAPADSRSNRPDLRGNRQTIRILTRSESGPATNRRTKRGWAREKQSPSRRSQAIGQRA